MSGMKSRLFYSPNTFLVYSTPSDMLRLLRCRWEENAHLGVLLDVLTTPGWSRQGAVIPALKLL